MKSKVSLWIFVWKENEFVLLLQGPTLTDDFLSLDLGDIDIILGVPRLPKSCIKSADYIVKWGSLPFFLKRKSKSFLYPRFATLERKTSITKFNYLQTDFSVYLYLLDFFCMCLLFHSLNKSSTFYLGKERIIADTSHLASDHVGGYYTNLPGHWI